MLKLLASFVLIITVLLSSYAASEYERPIDWNGNIYKIINDYNKEHAQFFKQVCEPGDQARYEKLLKLYRGQGFYLPKLGDDIDRQAIIKNMHHFQKKIKFLDKQIENLKKLKSFPNYALISEPINTKVTSLLNLKKQYNQAITKNDKEKILRESRIEMTQLKKLFDIFMDQIFFMKSYNFPNDYLANRSQYELYKEKEGKKNKKKANEIFFYRKITEDGAYDPDRSRPDKYIRTALDTLYLSLNKANDFLTENIRYDLEWIERHLEKLLTRGKKVHLARLNEWSSRAQATFRFYQELLETKNKDKAKFLVKKENEAAYNLRNFVYKKQAEAYAFWVKRKELYKALFSLETILVHEVGVLDGPFGLERTSVAKVVLNRVGHDFYNQLSKKQELIKHLPESIDWEDEHWLNVLFRVGEFSFTYHYIPAVSGIFCPDMSRRGRAIRKQNLKFALRAIKSHDGDFNALRYFSRISMLGKIDMSSVWRDYERLPEIPGLKSSHQNHLRSHYYADRYQYFYTFKDIRGVTHEVLRIRDKVYSMRWTKGVPEFYDYRNPHLFAYFSKKN